MEAMDIVFIVLGLACVAVSFFLSEKLAGSKKQEEKLMNEFQRKFQQKLLEKENLELLYSEARQELSGEMKEQVEECVLEAKEEMNRLANEKMLAFSEYSDQVLEKIHQDHAEVVFLYDMLKEKESSLKDFAAKLEGNRKQVEELLTDVKEVDQSLGNRKEELEQVLLKMAHERRALRQAAAQDAAAGRKNRSGAKAGNDVKPDQAPGPKKAEESSGAAAGGPTSAYGQPAGRRNAASGGTAGADGQSFPAVSSSRKKKNSVRSGRPDSAAAGSDKDAAEESSGTGSEKKEDRDSRSSMKLSPAVVSFGTPGERNEQILTLHSGGKSVVEISKMLGLGQGEVKLVIDLFQGTR